MQIWLMTVGEPLPTDPGNQRLHRTGILAGILSGQGHEVTWWTSTFDHFRKVQRWRGDHTAAIDDHYRLHAVHSPGYTRNISPRRILDHAAHARRVRRLMAQEPERPDVILCSLPTLELCRVAVDYGRAWGVPVVLDIRDLWPDIFLDLAPSWARPAANLALLYMFRTAAYACARAAAITGITPGFVDWGLAYADRPRTPLDRDFPLGYPDLPQPPEALLEARRFWSGLGLDEPVKLRVCFFGTLGNTMAGEMMTVIAAARQLDAQDAGMQFVICGTGDKLEAYRRAAEGCSNIIFPGWVDAPKIRVLMEMSSAGLLPYRSRADFVGSIPNKVAEYLSAGLPIVSSLQGLTENLLRENECGVTYRNGEAASLVQVLRTLCGEKDRLRRMARNAASLFAKRFSAQRVYTDMAAYLQEVARGFSAGKNVHRGLVESSEV